jgi:hypothetical protein
MRHSKSDGVYDGGGGMSKVREVGESWRFGAGNSALFRDCQKAINSPLPLGEEVHRVQPPQRAVPGQEAHQRCRVRRRAPVAAVARRGEAAGYHRRLSIDASAYRAPEE